MSFKLTDFITVTTSGNIGLSATPKSTNANGTSMQINNAGLVWHWQGDGIDSMYISQNMYYDGVSWKRMISGYGSLMRLNGNTGDTLFYQTTTGAADSAISDWINPLSLKNNGSVGIGTTSTEGKLTINYTAAELPSSGTTSNSAIQIISSLNNQLNIGLNTVSGEYGSFIQASDNNLAVPYPLHLQPNGGNVGIAKSPSTYRLDLETTSGGNGLKITRGTADFQVFQAANGASYVGTGNADTLHLITGGSSKMSITSGGNVGIGNSPSNDWADSRAIELGANAILWTEQASGQYNSLSMGLNFYVNSSGATLYKSANVTTTRYQQYQGSHIFQTAGTGTPNTSATFVNQLTISSGGIVTINTAGSGTDKLQVQGTVTVWYDTNFNRASKLLYDGVYVSGAQDGFLVSAQDWFVYAGGSGRFCFTSTGALSIGSTDSAYGTAGQVLTSNGNTSPSWSTPSGQKGEPGSTGAQGTTGANSTVAGPQGAAGTNGGTGAQGTAGSTGGTGGTGAQGATGSTGGTGGTGAKGEPGSNGSTGSQGTTGSTGGTGGTGAQGSTGGTGGTGSQGTAGSNGGTGAQGTTGSTGGSGGTGAQGTSGVATFPYSGTAVFSNQIQLSNSDGYIYGGSITTRSGARAIHMGYTGTCIFQAERTDSSSSAFIIAASSNQTYFYSRVSGGSTVGRRFLFTMGSSTAYAVETNNYVTFYGGYGGSSDRLFKKNIEDSNYGLSEVNSLKPRRFYWKDETKSKVKQIGFIAQELEEILPEAVRGHEGNKSIMDNSIIPVLTKAIQELSQQVTDLKAEVELLK